MNNYNILRIAFATEAVIYICSSKNFIKKRKKKCRCFPIKFVKFLRTTFSQNNSGGCFCCQKRSKETKRYSKKRYSADIFVET